MLSVDKIKEMLGVDDIIRLATHLQGSDEFYYDSQNNPIFCTSLDHPDGATFKLYYYDETKLFHCYTGSAESYDVFEMVKRATDSDFKAAYAYIIDFFHFDSLRYGFVEKNDTLASEEWDIFQKISDYTKKESDAYSYTPVQENMLEYFYPLAAPTEWLTDGISADVMLSYGIRIDSALSKVIIPHRDINGTLVGIRGRSFDPIDLLDGKKYMPVYINKKLYNHRLGYNLYGIYENKEAILRTKKAFVCEGEKSVLQAATFYGVDNCFTVATCGSSFSREQMDLLLSLGVEEIILGYDREFTGGRGAPDTVAYEDKLLKTVAPLLPYVNVSVIIDYDHLLPYKGSPTDCGRDAFEKLYHSRVKLYTEHKPILDKKRRK